MQTDKTKISVNIILGALMTQKMKGQKMRERTGACVVSHAALNENHFA